MQKMNKKGVAFHLIIFGILLVLATFILAIIDQSTGIGPRGLWQSSFFWAVQDAEMDLLASDAQMGNVVTATKEEMDSLTFIPDDFGCGFLERGSPAERVPLLNTPENYCDLNVARIFLEEFEANLADLNLEETYEVKLIGKEVIGNTAVRKMISSSEKEVQRQGGILFPEESFLIKPFYLRYEYNPSFRTNVRTSFLEFLQAGRAVPRLVHTCKGQTDLETCIIENLPDSRWDAYTDCLGDAEVYGNITVFCFDGDEDWRYSFAVDFS